MDWIFLASFKEKGNIKGAKEIWQDKRYVQPQITAGSKKLFLLPVFVHAPTKERQKQRPMLLLPGEKEVVMKKEITTIVIMLKQLSCRNSMLMYI